MGLRELKAERTRAAITAAALTLFERDGYDATTMQAIAAAAEVGTSTLYRYFPTKVDLLLEPVAEWTGSLTAGLAARPADEPVAVALRAAVLNFARSVEDNRDRVRQLRAVFESTPVARAALWDLYSQEFFGLAAAVAARTGTPPDDTDAVLSAHLALAVANVCLQASWSPDQPAVVELADRYLAAIAGGQPTLLR
ncbi:MAG: TetR/AcrR family transcriptional regulator; helix-turn-helix transcriptional regulator [Propionibacteriaceae bacterium]|jgi:AcrR family transcriptional regulator|nr:TetR/AcrR family transcriptional regulator; helix-turn-helix transcriptional regulator [Propionibacteriaceae bacterium]